MAHKVTWFEGMTLDPHHFQQWDRFHQANLNFRIHAVSPHSWGVGELAIDQDALINGQFRLLRCSGLQPDGLAFNMPDVDQLPDSRNFQVHFPATAEMLGVFLVVPSERLDGRNCLLRDDNAEGRDSQSGESVNSDVRFLQDVVSVNDETTGQNARQIGIARSNFQVRFTGEEFDNLSAIKIAEIGRAADGRFALSETFVPSSLRVGATENLTQLTGHVLELMVAKSSALSKWRHRLPSGQVRFLTTDFAVLGPLQVINGFIPQVDSVYMSGASHPEQLYELLTSLGGQLTTFATDSEVDFPHYDHTALGDCFGALAVKIEDILGGITAANYISVILEKTREALYVGRMIDDFVLQEADFYVLGSGDTIDEETMKKLVETITVSSPETIDAVFESTTEGLAVEMVDDPPAGLPTESGKYYFRLEKVGPFWEAICRSRSIAIWAPTDFADLKIELIAVL